jgi:dTDP-4-amino-4,6-dideoxygalactose transaminase
MILCANPKAGYLAQKAAIDAAVLGVLEGGRYVLGAEVTAFEAEFAAYIGVQHGIGVANGTDAIVIALKAAGIGPGDEVVTTAHTAVATVAAIELAGAIPVFADIDPRYFTIDPERVERVLSARTKAIVPVHLYGQAADLGALSAIAEKHGLTLIEDCAQCHGATYGGKRLGSFGALACFSSYPTKNLGAIGDGGVVVTNDTALAERCRLIREYGWAERYVSHIPGQNSRLDEIQAAILRVKLTALDAGNARRQRLANIYDTALAQTGLALPQRRPGASHVFHLYVVRSARRDATLAALKERDIGALIHFPVPVHLQPAYKGRLRGADALPETERAAREVLSLPMYPELADSDAQVVINALQKAEESR